MIFNGYKFDGEPAYLDMLIKQFGSVAQAVASTTIFPPKAIVEKLNARAVCNAVRNNIAGKRPGESHLVGDQMVMLDDNSVPDMIFSFCFVSDGKSPVQRVNKYTQLNHIYQSAGKGPDYFANLANLCLTPTFIAKLTDGHEKTKILLKYRAYKLFGFNPEPGPPSWDSYDEEFSGLNWYTVDQKNIATFEQFKKRFNACKNRNILNSCKCGMNAELII